VNAAPIADARRLGAFWFGIQVVWTAVLGVVLQDRAAGLSPQPVLAYAELAAAGAAVASIVQVVAGIFSDRARVRAGDRRAFYRIGVLFAIPAIVVLPAVTSLGALWSAMLLLQVGMNVAGGPYQAIVSDYLPPERVGRASSWMSIYQFSGSVVGILLTTQLRGVALGIALAACLAGGWLATDLYLRSRPHAPAIAAAPLRLDANVRTVLASRAFINLGFYTLFGFLFFFVRESLGVPDARTTTGILILAFTIAGVIGAAVAGRPADRLDKRLVVTVACIAIAISVGAFAAAPTVAVSLVCAIASGVAWGAFFTADWSIAYAVLPRDAMAKAMGVWNLALAVPQVAAPAITGPLVAALDARRAGLGPRVALICVIVEFAIGTAWLWRLRLSRARAAPRETIPP
jgi:MFS family permease